MRRLARAQDRKFEGYEGYAMARRLWVAEEELRVARSTAASLGTEVGQPMIGCTDGGQPFIAVCSRETNT